MNDFQTLIIDRFLTLYGEPNTDDLEAFFAEYRKALGGVRRDILARLSDRVVWNHKFPTWPTVGNCLTILEKLRISEMAPPAFPEIGAPAGWQPPTPEAKARAKHLRARFCDHIAKIDPTYTPREREGETPRWAREALAKTDAATMKLILSAPDNPKRKRAA